MLQLKLKKTSFLLGTVFSLAIFSANATVIPIGVQLDIAKTTVTSTWGWTECFSTAGDSSGDSMAGILSSCAGDNLMLATYRNGSPTYEILAAASFSDATFDTGTSNNTHTANGSEWYFNDSYSWGFTELGNSVMRQSCDTELTNDWGGPRADNIGMCWHTNSGNLSSGWQYNKIQDDVESAQSLYSNHTRVILVANDIPESGTLALFGLGLAGLGFARRKKA